MSIRIISFEKIDGRFKKNASLDVEPVEFETPTFVVTREQMDASKAFHELPCNNPQLQF